MQQDSLIAHFGEPGHFVLQGTVQHSATEQLYASMQKIYPGQVAPPFTLKNDIGEEVSLADFEGKVVYIDFLGGVLRPLHLRHPKLRTEDT